MPDCRLPAGSLDCRFGRGPPFTEEDRTVMPIDPESLLATRLDDDPCAYDERDCILYALATGFGEHPSRRVDLAYVYENGPLRTIPTMINRFHDSRFLADCGWDFERLVHADERLDLFRPLPPAATMLANRRVTGFRDLGADTGAVITTESEFRLAKDGTVLAICARTYLARGDGGSGVTSMSVSVPHRLPSRDPDLSAEFQTAENQALRFRLVDSMSPIHVEAEAARRAGFERPVLQGRCTFGIACRAVLETICDYDFTLIRGIDLKLRAPVYPGDLIRTEMWQDRNIVSFRCVVPARGTIVADNGKCTLAA
jgi:acyl dehydratase